MKIKRIIALLMSAALCVSFAGCGNSAHTSASVTKSSGTSTSSSSEVSFPSTYHFDPPASYPSSSEESTVSNSVSSDQSNNNGTANSESSASSSIEDYTAGSKKYLASEWAETVLDLLNPKATFTVSDFGLVQFVMQAESKDATYDDVYHSYRSILKLKAGIPMFKTNEFGVQNILLTLKDGAGNVVYTVSMDCSSSPTAATKYINPKYTKVMKKVFKG